MFKSNSRELTVGIIAMENKTLEPVSSLPGDILMNEATVKTANK